MLHLSSRLLGVAVAAAMLASAAAAARQTTSKPKLSEAVRAAIEKEGPDAAVRRFEAIYPGGKDAYELDTSAVTELMMAYAQRGDQKTSQAVMRIFMMASEAVYVPSTPKPPAPARAAEPVNTGPKRKDLARFFGVFGNPGLQKGRIAPHNLFVNVSCDGYLHLGGLSGGTGGWIMRSESDTVFVQMHVAESDPVALRLEFQVGPDGRATAFLHNFYWRKDNPLTRLGDLPAGFEDLTWCPEELRR